jgi:hypothetical protein
LVRQDHCFDELPSPDNNQFRRHRAAATSRETKAKP